HFFPADHNHQRDGEKRRESFKIHIEFPEWSEMPQVACSDRRGIRAGFIPDGRAASPKVQTALYRNRWEIKGKRAI
ncbi:TPA: hypothetical protein ACKL1Y_000830, partial [Neisseria gonorrhoeae]